MTEGDEFLGTPVEFPDPRSCPSDGAWIEVCAGRVQTEASEQLLEHAADCERCGSLLREATIIWRGDADADEEEFIAGLRSSCEAWQTDLATRLLRESQTGPHDTPSRIRSRKLWWPVLIAATTAAGFAVLLVYRSAHSVDVLLAQAYDHQRLTELRIPGGEPVALYSPQRGVPNTEHEPPELLEVRLVAERALQKDSTNAYWHQVLGRIDVIEMEPESAVTELQLAEVRQSSLPHIEFDLGNAYFELGERSGDTGNYAYAAEHFSRSLADMQNRDPAALYNRALCWQRSGLPDLARNDLKNALHLERDPAWRKAIQDRMRSIESSPTAGPESKTNQAHPLSNRVDNFEDLLLVALKRDFGRPSPQSNFSVAQIANLGLRHGDHWLSDWMAAARRVPSPPADRALSDAVLSNMEGSSDKALRFAGNARRLYQSVGNRPGLLRAQIEEVYAARRKGDPESCLSEIAAINISKITRRYPYLYASLLLENGACLGMRGNLDNATESFRRALESASRASFPHLMLRAEGYAATVFTTEGSYEEGWQLNVAGLLSCAQLPCDASREYQFLSDLTLDAGAMDLRQVAVILGEASSQRAFQVGNIQIAAYALELLGRNQMAARDLDEAARTFARADNSLKQLGEVSATQIYRADWSSDRAELLFLEGSRDRALDEMQRSLTVVEGTHAVTIQGGYWTRRAELELGAHQFSAALQSARKGAGVSTVALHSIRQRAGRLAWQRSSEEAWQTLVDCLLHRDQTRPALSAWLYFKETSDARLPALQWLEATYDRMHEVPLIGLRNVHPGATYLIYVRLRDRYTVFVSEDGNETLRVAELPGDPDFIDQLARTFSMLCADPHSNLTELRAVGAQLYSILISPALRINRRELRVDTPAQLDGIPFAALVGPDGSYIGDHTAIVHLAESWAFQSGPLPSAISSSSKLVLVDAAAGDGHATSSIPARYDEVSDLSRDFSGVVLLAGSRAIASTLLATLPSADVFHFSGHAETQPGPTRLLLAGGSSLAVQSIDGIVLHHCQLVVLAACATLGETPHQSSESFDLPDAFLRAGAQHVLASRWDVDSQATRVLMLAFYEAILKGKSPSIALMTAENELRGQMSFAHPYYWAPFWLLEQ
jgi:CHAT domain-containing protein/tetratricopeptide (TPR) repeat protein